MWLRHDDEYYISCSRTAVQQRRGAVTYDLNIVWQLYNATFTLLLPLPFYLHIRLFWFPVLDVVVLLKRGS